MKLSQIVKFATKWSRMTSKDRRASPDWVRLRRQDKYKMWYWVGSYQKKEFIVTIGIC